MGYINSGSILAYYIKYLLGSTNIHINNNELNICIFSTRRSGSTLLMQLINTYNGIKYVDQPFDMSKYNPYKKHLPKVANSKFINLGENEEKQLKNYFKNIVLKDKLKGYSQWNYLDDYKFKSNRYVIKILNCMPLIDWFIENFEMKCIYLLRHPIPVANSVINRGWENSSLAYLSNPYYSQKYLDEELIKYAYELLKKGSKLEKYVLEWCLENQFPLNFSKKQFYTLVYEKMLIEYARELNALSNFLELKDPEKMIKKIQKPSKTTTKESRTHIEEKGFKHLAYSWKEKISENEYNKVEDILTRFNIKIDDYINTEY